MSPALRALLAGVVIITGGVAVYSFRDGSTTFADLQAAGIGTDCNPRLIVCSEKINPVLRNRLADAGYVLPAAHKYARVVRQAFNCANPDGGVRELVVPGFEHFSTANDDATIPEPSRCIDRPCTDLPGFCGNGPKNVALAAGIAGVGAPPCRRRPAATPLANCHSVFWDGGSPTDYSDTGNVMQPGIFVDSASCEQVECTVMSGDHPETDL